MSSHVQGDDLLLQFYLLLLQELHFPILNGIGPGMPSFMCTTAAENTSTNSYDSSANMGNEWQRMRVSGKKRPQSLSNGFTSGRGHALLAVLSSAAESVRVFPVKLQPNQPWLPSGQKWACDTWSSDVICLKF